MEMDTRKTVVMRFVCFLCFWVCVNGLRWLEVNYEGNVKGLVTRGRLTPEKAEKTFSLHKGVLDYNEFRYVDMVIEAVIEIISLKQSIFCDIEKICPPHFILATNTSTIDLNIVGEHTNSQDRVIEAHFFSPAHIMSLLEIVRTDKTSAQVILDLMTVGKAMKKVFKQNVHWRSTLFHF